MVNCCTLLIMNLQLASLAQPHRWYEKRGRMERWYRVDGQRTKSPGAAPKRLVYESA